MSQIHGQLVPVILSGGSGTRLWPLSRSNYPKQFLKLTSDASLFQQAVSRISHLPDTTSPIVVCNEEHRFLVAEQLRSTGCENSTIILEPSGRDTAPAIALAAIQALRLHKNPTLCVFTADHIIAKPENLIDAIREAKRLVKVEKLVTFGVLPDKPETAYGYIQFGEGIGSTSALSVTKFEEKPNKETAQRYFDSKQYLWNSGMFVFSAQQYLNTLNQYAPLIAKACEASMMKAAKDFDFMRPDKISFESSPNLSIDFAVMEKAPNIVVIPIDIGWRDVGSWEALWETADKDDSGNVVKGEAITLNSENCYFHSTDRTVTAIGLQNLIVIDTADAILVADKHESQNVKQLTKLVREHADQLMESHRKVHRPWGYYDCVECGKNFQVKRIFVDPGAALSLQVHQFRSEHWVVVSGTATVTNGESTFLVRENESTYIPVGTIHRLQNAGDTPLEIIEIQSGSYLGEDDIIRYSDNYNRAPTTPNKLN